MAILAGLAMIALSIGMVWSHFRSRGLATDRAQFRRRILTSGLLGLIGIAIVTGQFIIAAVQPILFVVFWLAVLTMAAVLGLSGMTDLFVTRGQLRRRQELAAQEIQRLKAEVAQARERQHEHAHLGNGRDRTEQQS
ncbi:MAG: hypothetical protein SGJ19_04825 [Planctomycetia bacterium]|nr:hypothetical protein [Planctomycetia bacterium]